MRLSGLFPTTASLHFLFFFPAVGASFRSRTSAQRHEGVLGGGDGSACGVNCGVVAFAPDPAAPVQMVLRPGCKRPK
eukprot:6533997-Prymnesium_polylepis.1